MQAIHIKTIALIFLTTLFSNAHAQEIEKKDIYLVFQKNDGTAHLALGKKFTNEKGLNFNLYKHSFLHKKGFKKETLSINKIPHLSVIDEMDIESLEKQFRETNHSKLMKKYPGGYPPYNRNFIFNTFIVERLKDSIVVYEVIFRNEGIQM